MSTANEGQISRAAPVVRIGIFADVHYAEMVYGDRHCEDSPAKLAACIDSFGQGELDFAVCMGASSTSPRTETSS